MYIKLYGIQFLAYSKMEEFLRSKGFNPTGWSRARIVSTAWDSAKTQKEKQYVSRWVQETRPRRYGYTVKTPSKECTWVTRFINYLCRKFLPEHVFAEYTYLQPYREALFAYLIKDSNAVLAETIRIVMPNNNTVTLLEWPRTVYTERYILRPVLIEFPGVSHYTLIFQDQNADTDEYFESNGVARWTSAVTSALREYLPNLILPEEYCPKRALQKLTGDYLCANWSLLYGFLRIHCPELNRQELIDLMSNVDLERLIYGWTCYLSEQLEKSNIAAYVDIRDKLDKVLDILKNQVPYLHEQRSKLDRALVSGNLQQAKIIYDKLLVVGF